MIDFDVETTGFQPHSGSQYAFLYIFMGDDLEPVAYPYVPAIFANANLDHHADIQAWFDRGKVEGIRAHNAKFDRAFADSAGFDIPGDGMWHDSMLVAQTINERRSNALKSLAVELLGEGADEDQKKVKDFLTKERARRKAQAKEDGVELIEPNYSDVPMEIMEKYALEDVILTRKISDMMDITLINDPGLQRTVEFERQAMDALYAVEKRGIPARRDDYMALEVEVMENLERLEDRVIELAEEGNWLLFAKTAAGKKWSKEEGADGLPYAYEAEDGTRFYMHGAPNLDDFNPNSSAQVHAALVARGADLSYMSVEDGKLSMDADNLRAVDDELAAAILEFRAEKKVLSTYVQPMVGRSYETSVRSWKEPYVAPDGRIHATYRQVGARTGRMSCADPNMQNQPRDDLRLRYCIAADPGFKLVACDLSNIEMYLFAAFAGEGRMLDTIRNGGDLHTLTAEGLGFRDRRRPGGGYESARQQGKVFNFTKIYGGGLRSIKRYFRVSQDTAKLYNRRYSDLYPEIQRLNNKIESRLYQQGYVSDNVISGRRFRVEDVRKEGYKVTNWLIQGTAAALLKEALIKLHNDGVPVVALVHDEIVAHVPEEQAEETKALIIRRMTENEAINGIVPLKAEGDIIDRWSQAKDPDFVPNFAKAAA